MALDLTALDTRIHTLLRMDSANPGITQQQRWDIINDVYANYNAAVGTISATIAGSGASVDNSRWQFTGLSSASDPFAVDSVEIDMGGGVTRPLALVSEDVVRYLQQTEGRVVTTAAGVRMSSAKITHDNSGAWFISGYFYPMRVSNFTIIGRRAQSTLAAGATVLAVSPVAFYMIARIAAVVIGAVLKRPSWLLARIGEPVPAQLRMSFDLNRHMFHKPNATARELLMGIVPPREPLPVPELSRIPGDEP